jgi:hypothetical protein
MGRPALKRGGPARPPGVIRFQHRRKINCGSYSEHTCAHSRPHDPRKLLVIEGLELLASFARRPVVNSRSPTIRLTLTCGCGAAGGFGQIGSGIWGRQ